MRFLPDDNLKYPILVSIDDGSTASGFYLGYENGVYFITARHVLFKKNEQTGAFVLKGKKAQLKSYPHAVESQIPIEIEILLDVIHAKGGVLINPTGATDVVVVKIGEIRTHAENNNFEINFVDVNIKQRVQGGRIVIVDGSTGIKKYDTVLLSNDVFIFGYPNSLGIKNYPQIDYSKPLLRKGIIAGKNDIKKTIILDCPVYFGNSGGLVLEVEETGNGQRQFRIIGVVSEFIPFEEIWYNFKHNYSNTEIENSGYSVVTPMDAVFELINNSKNSLVLPKI